MGWVLRCHALVGALGYGFIRVEKGHDVTIPGLKAEALGPGLRGLGPSPRMLRFLLHRPGF